MKIIKSAPGQRSEIQHSMPPFPQPHKAIVPANYPRLKTTLKETHGESGFVIFTWAFYLCRHKLCKKALLKRKSQISAFFGTLKAGYRFLISTLE